MSEHALGDTGDSAANTESVAPTVGHTGSRPEVASLRIYGNVLPADAPFALRLTADEVSRGLR